MHKVLFLFLLVVFLFQSAYSKSLKEEKVFKITSQNIDSIILCDNFVKKLFGEVGYKVKLVKFDASARSLMQTNNGRYDGDVCRIDGTWKKYKNIIQINPQATMLYGAILVNKKYFKKKVMSLKELNNAELGIRIGHLYAEKAVENYHKGKVTRLKTDEQLLKMLQLGRLKAGIMIYHNALRFLQNSPAEYGDIVIASPYFVNTKVYFYIHKKHNDIVDKLNKAAKKLHNQGFVINELNKYIAPFDDVVEKFVLK